MQMNRARTINATVALLVRSRNNEDELERMLARNGKLTTGELASKLKWTINQTNSTIYRLKSKNVIDYSYLSENGKVVKLVSLIHHSRFLK